MTDRQLLLKAATTAQLTGRVVEDRLTTIALPAFLLAVLTHVRDHAPVSPSALSIASGAPPTTLRDNIQRLVDRGLAERRPNPDDGRSYLLVLTPCGEATAAAAGAALADAYTELERRLPRPRAEYERMLEELNGAMQEMVGPG